MRLRPSGRAGPLATQIGGFTSYQETRGLDLGAHGADARARGVGVAGIRRAGGEGHPRRFCSGRAMPR